MVQVPGERMRGGGGAHTWDWASCRGMPPRWAELPEVGEIGNSDGWGDRGVVGGVNGLNPEEASYH